MRAATLLAFALAVPAAAAAQDLDAAARQRLFYQVKPATVLVWAGATADITVVAPTAASREGIQWINDPLLLNLHAEISTFGSGWLISPEGYLVTNGHVIQLFHENNEDKLQGELLFAALEESGFFARQAAARGGGPGDVLTHDKKMQLMTRILPFARITLEKELSVYLQNWERYAAEVKEYSPPILPFEGRASIPGTTLATGKDVAVLKIEGRDLPTMRLGDSQRMQIGDNVFVAGYPGSASFNDFLKPKSPMEASFTRGQISSLKVDVKGSSLIQTDAAITFGNSGGPLLNEKGEVVGMATMTNREAQGFNYAVPTSVINEFVRASGVTAQPSMFDRAWTAALDDYYRAESLPAGREKLAAYQASVTGFDQALRVLPNLADALKLRREAMARIDEMGNQPAPDGGMPRVVWIVLGAVALGIALLALGLRMRRAAPQGANGGVAAKPVPGNGGASAGRLVVKSGPLLGNSFPVSPRGVRIGRDPSTCQVVLSEETVSREHAFIAASGNNSDVTLRNLSGTNRTFVNDRAIQEAVLKSGDQIKIGSSVLTFENN
jgi:hypothetical protein